MKIIDLGGFGYGAKAVWNEILVGLRSNAFLISAT